MLIDDFTTEKEKVDFFKSHPPKLYKYREFGNDNHLRIISDCELYFANPEQFNDPYDCALPFKLNKDTYTKLNLYKLVEQTLLAKFPHMVNNPQSLNAICNQKANEILSDPNYTVNNWPYGPDQMKNMFGILSLTSIVDNYLMWSHYGKSHTGFCVEFDTRILVESLNEYFAKVLYSREVPLISITDLMNVDIFNTLTYTKNDIWSYENEYRFSKIDSVNSISKFPPEALTGIYFGCNAPKLSINKLAKIAEKNFPKAKFYQFHRSSDSFKIVSDRLKIY